MHRHTICMVCDFFHPRLGGVENHILANSAYLVALGCKVIVLTHAREHRTGIRYLSNGVKVYYAPLPPFAEDVVLPVFVDFINVFRHIIVREGVTIVHGHQATSTLAHQCMAYAKIMGLKTVFTSHSLLDPTDVASIYLNKIMKFSFACIDHVICVSQACRNNIITGTGVTSSAVSVVPNAIDSDAFQPKLERNTPLSTVTVVLLSRLVYRKGIDLVVQVIPQVCARHPEVRFIIGGDGDRRLALEEMREHHQLHDVVEIIGSVAPDDVSKTLRRGDIFLNCSLTEAFCMAVVEAVSCGLFVVSTDVGGLPEVLPQELVAFAKPNVDDLVHVLCMNLHRGHVYTASQLHEKVRAMYHWKDVASATINVYDSLDATEDEGHAGMFQRFRCTGPVFSVFAVVIVAIATLIWAALEWWEPSASIERCPHYCCATRGHEQQTGDDDSVVK